MICCAEAKTYAKPLFERSSQRYLTPDQRLDVLLREAAIDNSLHRLGRHIQTQSSRYDIMQGFVVDLGFFVDVIFPIWERCKSF